MSKQTKKRRSGTLQFGLIAVIIIAIFVAVNNEQHKSTSPATTTSAEATADDTSGLYKLKMGTDFKPGLSYQDDLGISLVIALDVSGSMKDSPQSGGEGKYLQAAAALDRIVGVLDSLTGPNAPMIKVALLRFSDEVETVFPLTELSPDVIAKLKALVQDPGNFEPGGKTAIGQALETGTALLAQSGTIMRSLIIISDGENTIGPEPARVMDAVQANRNDASTADYPVRTSSTLIRFVGFDMESGYFDQFAAYGARVSAAANGEQLSAELIGLLNADIKMLE